MVTILLTKSYYLSASSVSMTVRRSSYVLANRTSMTLIQANVTTSFVRD
jgi:hypothetical protein